MAIPSQAVSLNDIYTCRGESCPGCDPLSDSVFAMVSTLLAAGSPYLYYNERGGVPEYWQAKALTEWTAGDADRVLCLGKFIMISSVVEAEILRLNNFNATPVAVTHADFAANPPTCMAGVDQSMIVIGGQNGYAWITYDGGRNLLPLMSGDITTENINAVAIAPDNENVIVFVCDNNVILKSTNGGDTIRALTGPSAADNLIEVVMKSQNLMLVVNDDAEIWETLDAGETVADWVQQPALEGAPAAITRARIVRDVSGVFFCTFTAAVGSMIYENVEDGAGGYWEPVYDPTTAPLDYPVNSVAMAGPNLAIAVGGDGNTVGYIIRLA